MGVGAGLGIMGGTLGGIGDIIQAQNYHKPHLEPATGREKRLRDLAQSQLLAGGQQLLGGTALYNQMVPMLMGMLPGMEYHPGTAGETAGDMQGGGGSALRSYQDSLRNMQEAQAAQQKLTELKAQKKGVKAGGGRRKAVQQQIKQQKQLIKGMPTVAERERQMYTAGVQPANTDIYNIRMGQAPTQEQSLASVRGMMDALNDRPNIDLSAIYGGGG
jgi:hypothetical protein